MFLHSYRLCDLRSTVDAYPRAFCREGNDGLWSTFEIRVGTPPQTVRVLPATLWQETWAVWNGTDTGVYNPCNTSLGVSADCADTRGDTFSYQKSSTWVFEQNADAGLNQGLGYTAQGIYGMSLS